MDVSANEALGNDEVELGQIAKALWFNKITILLFLFMSVPLSISYTSWRVPLFQAEAMFEKPSNRNNGENTLGATESLIFSALLGSEKSASESNHLSIIRSNSFLKSVIFNNEELDSVTLDKFCRIPFGPPPAFSFRSLLVALGLSQVNVPNEDQKVQLKIDCVRRMIEIKYDTYQSVPTNAVKILVNTKDAFFSANLANQVVKKYFLWHEENRDLKFQNIKAYLSDTISEAQYEFSQASEIMQNFVIEHALQGKINASVNSVNSNPSAVRGIVMVAQESPFRIEMKKEIARLGQLEKSQSQFEEAKVRLSMLKEKDNKSIRNFVLSTQVQGVLSRSFISYISKIEELSFDQKDQKSDIKTSIEAELKRLEGQIRAIEKKIKQREDETLQLMNVENRYQELALDVQKKQLIFEGLKDQLNRKILETGLENLDEPVLLTKAVPPFSSSSSSKKVIVLMAGVLFTVFGIIYVLVRQTFLKRVYTLGQLQKLSSLLPFFKIRLKDLNWKNKKPDETVLSQSVYSNTQETGALGCVIDISGNKGSDGSLASNFAASLGSLIAVDSKKVACLEPLQSKTQFLDPFQLVKTSQLGKSSTIDGATSNLTFMVADDEGLIDSGEISKIKKKYANYDKVLCALGAGIGDITKFNFIQRCDFYVLIGKSAQINERDFQKFSNKVWERGKKCLGFFLID